MLHQIETQILILLLIATLVGIGARRFRLPYTLALVVVGLLVGFIELDALGGVELNADLLLFLLLPALLFEAAFHIDWPDFKRELSVILTLVIPGVLVAVSATALLAYVAFSSTGLIPEFGWAHAFIFAAVISATDPISVLALFREFGVPERLYMLVEGESLLNDGVAVVVFTILLAVFGVAAHGQTPPSGLDTWADVGSYSVITFGRMAIGGAMIGGIIGGVISLVTRQIDDHLLEVTLTTLVAYGSFLVAEKLHCSGVLSTVVAGLVMGSFGARTGMSPATRNAVEDFWEYIAFLANSFIFLLVGMRLEAGNLARDLAAVAIGFVVVLLARFFAIYGGIPVANRLAVRAVPKLWKIVMVWGGLRGSLSMVLILTLPEGFPGKELLVNMVFGVVALSLFLQGLTMQPLIRKIGLQKGSALHEDYERARAEVRASIRALDLIEHRRDEGLITDVPYRRLKAWYETRRANAEADAATHAGGTDVDEQLVETLRTVAAMERETIRRSLHLGLINTTTAGELDAAILSRLEALHASERHGEDALRAHLAELLSREAATAPPDPDPVADDHKEES